MLSVLQPPPTAEELALKDQVTQVLTSQGVLAKLKAELRAAVFEVMHEREGFVKKYTLNGPKLDDFPMETRTTALSLIVECLKFFHWENTLRVLLAETNAESEQLDSALLAKKLGLVGSYSSSKPTLFHLIESKMDNSDQTPGSGKTLPTTNYDDFDDDGKEADQPESISLPKSKQWEEIGSRESPSKEVKSTQQTTKDEAKDESKDGDGESSAEIEESMAEEVPSGSELGESNYTNYDDESQDQSAVHVAGPQPTTLYASRLQEESEGDDKDHDKKDGNESYTEVAVASAPPPPAPAKLPALPPLVSTPSNTFTGGVDDDFDAEEEAERLRKLDAALQAMEAEDDTGTLQQLKASLQMELQEQDSFVSGGGFGKAEDGEDDKEDEAETDKTGNDDDEDEDGYGSSDFEEEEVASEISEEMESMPELSDKEDESEDGIAISATAEPPHVLQNDTCVDSEDALNSYDYIEEVEKSGW